MNITINKYQETLFLNGWSITVKRDLYQYYYIYNDGKKSYNEKNVSAEELCKKFKLKRWKK